MSWLLYSNIFAFWYFQAFSAMLISVFFRQKEVLQAYSVEFQKNVGSQEPEEASEPPCSSKQGQFSAAAQDSIPLQYQWLH